MIGPFYLEELPNCDVVIFLIDNEDGVSDAVNREIQSAYELELRKIFVFCDENSKVCTDIQEKLKSDSANPKYAVVSKFREAARRAYISLIQDLVLFYRPNRRGILKKNDPNILTDTDSLPSKSVSVEGKEAIREHIINNNQPESIVYSIDKSMVHADITVYDYLMRLVDLLHPVYLRMNKNWMNRNDSTSNLNDKSSGDSSDINTNSSSNDQLLVIKFLASIMGKEDYDPIAYEQMVDYIISKQPEFISSFLKKRFIAMKYLCLGDYKSAVEHIKNALKEGIDNPAIPLWLVLDVAIDLRNVVKQIAGNNVFNRIRQETNEDYKYGQEVIDSSYEIVTYPVLDRMWYELNKSVLSYYEREQLSSPYLIQFSNDVYKLFNAVGDMFWIALLHGSYSHILYTRERMNSILTMLINLFSNRAPVIERIRLHYVMGENHKALEDIIRTYHAEADVFTPEEVKEIIASLKTIKPQILSTIALFGFIGRFGYYCDNETFEYEYSFLYQESLRWIEDKNSTYELKPYIFSFFKGTYQRVYKGVFCLKYTVDFVYKLVEKSGNKWIDDILDLFSGVDCSCLDKKTLKELFDTLFNLTKDANPEYQMKLSDVIVSQLVMNKSDIFGLVSSEMKNNKNGVISDSWLLYDHLYRENMNNDEYCTEEFFDYIKDVIEKIHNGNDQVLKGVIIYPSSIMLLHSAVCSVKKLFLDYQKKMISDICLDVLAIENHSVKNKIDVCEILIALCMNSDKKKDALIKKISRQLVDCYDKNTKTCSGGYGSDKDVPFQLELVYELILAAYGHTNRYGIISEYLFSIPHKNNYLVIQSLKYLDTFLSLDCSTRISTSILDIITNYVASVSYGVERDVKLCSIRVLIQLCRYKRTRVRALRRLIVFMGDPNADARLLVISGIHVVISDNPFVKNSRSELNKISEKYIRNIISQGKIDRHYLVRKYAEEASDILDNC